MNTSSKKNVTIDNTKNRPFLPIKEASDYLGVKISTLYQWTHTKRLTFYKNGKLVFFAKDDLNYFALNPDNRVLSQSELDPKLVN